MYKHYPQKIAIIPVSELQVGMWVSFSCSCGDAFHCVTAVGPAAPYGKVMHGYTKVEADANNPDCRTWCIFPNGTATIKLY